MVKRTSTRFIARMIEGAKPSEMPGFIPPQLATLKLRAPAGDKWIHEIKFDGYRIQVHLYKGKVKIFTRNGHDWANRFHLLAESFDSQSSGPSSMARSSSLRMAAPTSQNSGCTRQRPTEEHGVLAFDPLFLEGFDLRKSPQIERKRVLKMLFDETRLASPIVYSAIFSLTATRCMRTPAS